MSTSAAAAAKKAKMIEKLCQGFVALQVSFGLIEGIVFILNLSMLYQFIRRYLSKMDEFSNKPTKFLFFAGLALIICVLLVQILLFLVIVVFGCAEWKMNPTPFQMAVSSLFPFIYVFQSYLLSIISFTTLFYSFKGTAFEISKRILIIFKIIYVIIPILAVLSSFGPEYHKAKITAFTMIFMAIFFISIITIFIRKLIAVYKHSDYDPDLMRMITKLTVLTGISIFFSLLVPLLIICVIATKPGPVLGSGGMIYLTLTDVTTNLWCIAMTYSYFNDYYIKLCSKIHSKIQIVCARCLGQEARLKDIIKNETKTTNNTMELSVDVNKTETSTQSHTIPNISAVPSSSTPDKTTTITNNLSASSDLEIR